MGFIKKVIGTAVNAVETAVEFGINKIDEMEKKELQNQQDFINNSEFRNIYYIKYTGLEDKGLFLSSIKTYKVLNSTGECEYIIKEKVASDGRKFKIVDINGNEIGSIVKDLINISIGGEENNKKCTINIKGEGSFGIETYYQNSKYPSDRGHKIRMVGGSLTIIKDKSCKIYSISDRISWSKSEEVFSIYHVFFDKGITNSRYIIRFNNPAYKLKAIFTAFGLELI